MATRYYLAQYTDNAGRVATLGFQAEDTLAGEHARKVARDYGWKLANVRRVTKAEAGELGAWRWEPLSNAERQRTLKAKGKPIALTLHPVAEESMRRIQKAYGFNQRQAIEWALNYGVNSAKL